MLDSAAVPVRGKSSGGRRDWLSIRSLKGCFLSSLGLEGTNALDYTLASKKIALCLFCATIVVVLMLARHGVMAS